jgi:4-hydroxyphenylpyruvate dioxygenase
MTIEQTLTDSERLADLSLEQLQQLVGLVEHDPATDPFPISGWDALVWVVGNAAQTALHYQLVYGMELVAYAGPETGQRDHQSFVLRSGAARFVINGAVDPASPLVAVHAEPPAPESSTSRTTSATNTARCAWRRSPPTAT